MSGEDRELVLYLRSDVDYWDEFLEDKGYVGWERVFRENGFSDDQYEIEPIDEYDGFKDVDVALEWEVSDGREMTGAGRHRVVEAVEQLSPGKQDMDTSSPEEADVYTTRTKSY